MSKTFALRVLVCAVLCLAVVDAFSAVPLKHSRIAARTPMQSAPATMSLEVAGSQIAEVTNSLLAVAKETDFGGYAGPAVGLVILAVLIAALTNPYDSLKK